MEADDAQDAARDGGAVLRREPAVAAQRLVEDPVGFAATFEDLRERRADDLGRGQDGSPCAGKKRSSACRPSRIAQERAEAAATTTSAQAMKSAEPMA